MSISGGFALFWAILLTLMCVFLDIQWFEPILSLLGLRRLRNVTNDFEFESDHASLAYGLYEAIRLDSLETGTSLYCRLARIFAHH